MSQQHRSEEVVRRIRRRGERIAERELAEAVEKLEARGGLTDEQRRAVAAMADSIVEELLAAPAETVAAARREDPETLRTVVELFDPGETVTGEGAEPPSR